MTEIMNDQKSLGCGMKILIFLGLLITGTLGDIVGFILSAVNWRKKWAREVFVFCCITFVLHIFIAIAILAAIALPNYRLAKEKAREAELKAYTHSLQIALERYAVDSSGLYPESMHKLIELDYITSYPSNPFSDTRVVMKEIDFGDPDYEGNFTYVPVTINGRITGYYLLGWGSKKIPGKIDVDEDGTMDHVALVVTSGSEFGQTDSSYPPLKDLIKKH